MPAPNPNPIREIECQFCGKAFLQRLSWQKFCPGGECRRNYRQQVYEREKEARREARRVDIEASGEATRG